MTPAGSGGGLTIVQLLALYKLERDNGTIAKAEWFDGLEGVFESIRGWGGMQMTVCFTYC